MKFFLFLLLTLPSLVFSQSATIDINADSSTAIVNKAQEITLSIRVNEDGFGNYVEYVYAYVHSSTAGKSSNIGEFYVEAPVGNGSISDTISFNWTPTDIGNTQIHVELYLESWDPNIDDYDYKTFYKSRLFNVVPDSDEPYIIPREAARPYSLENEFKRNQYLRRGNDTSNSTTSVDERVNLYFDKVKPASLRHLSNYTFSQWKQSNGFNDPSVNVVNSKYYNSADLGLARDMNCVYSPPRLNRGTNALACYVSNHGDFFVNDIKSDFDKLYGGAKPFATVAMEYHPNASNNKVRFFAFDHNNNDLAQKYVPLDTGGAKPIPISCASCHGGKLDDNGNLNNSNFLPFDVFAVEYFSLQEKEKQLVQLKELNKMIYNTRPIYKITQFINGMYRPNIFENTTAANNSWVPNEWNTPELRLGFNAKIKPYCNGCHMAHELDLARYWGTTAINYGCLGAGMPHAEINQRNMLNKYENCNRTIPAMDENFEKRITWKNNGEFKFSRRSGNTPSRYTGPNIGANNSQHYAYMEASYGHAYFRSDSAILESALFRPDNTSLEFQYHMYGSNIGTLSIDVFSNGHWVNNIWYRSGQQQSSSQQDWLKATVDLSNFTDEIKVRFRAVAAGGYRGDIAIDDINIYFK